jgi:MoaA/NifB/PqqE/SkfB family radical SAM enzyme
MPPTTSQRVLTEKVPAEGASRIEWSVHKKWNPFNSYKLLAHVPRWSLIKRGKPIPQPALVTVDPINRCNLKCQWCNAGYILEHRARALSKQTLLELADFLGEWQGCPGWGKGVEAVCIAGGGEPLLNRNVGTFIERCVKHGIEVGVVTNGTVIDRFLEPLSLCTWVGVSVDAGSNQVFNRLKGLKPDAMVFNRVIENVMRLIAYAKARRAPLASERSGGHGVSYKFLLCDGNIEDVYRAGRIAKAIGCKNYHVRPVGRPWHRLDEDDSEGFMQFTPEAIERFFGELERARQLEDETFGVYGITHKFSNVFDIENYFSTCHALFMTAVFMPRVESDDENAFTMGLCCDRRGDPSLELVRDGTSVDEVARLWGSREHWGMFDALDIAKCPRCTYQPHNQIYEHVIQRDSMTYKFI